MSVRVKGMPKVQSADETESHVYTDSSIDQREVTVDGYTFHFGPNEVKNFLDEGVGRKVAAFKTDGVLLDTKPYGTATS